MKSYTDIEQSKKLAEILPKESADMCWCNNSIKGVSYTDEFSANLRTVKEVKDIFDSAFNEWDKYWKLIPCWSLAALLDQLEDVICDEEGNQWELVIKKENVQYDLYYLNICGEQENIELDRFYDNLIDCCYEMILKLKEKDLL